MSILGNFANPIFVTNLIVLMSVMLVSVPITAALRVFVPRAIVGPPRLPDTHPILPLFLALFMGFIAMFLAASSYVMWKAGGVSAPLANPPTQPDVVDKAFLYSVPPLSAALVLLFADLTVGGGRLLRRLGLDPAKLPAGVGTGALAALVIVPPTYLVSYLTDLIYRQVQFQHPGEHELLTALGAVSMHRLAHWILIAAATLIAPFSEELMFRAHLQTLIGRVLVLVSSPYRPRGIPVHPIVQTGLPLDAAALTPPPLAAPIAVQPLRPPVWQTWLAVLLTSCLFAMMHERWMWPPIFFLSLGLGYCYERTGNLWTSVTVHCIFNSISTFAFLASAHT